MNRYAIIDASAFEDTAKALHYYTQDLRHRSLFERQPEAALADLGPWLLQLPDHPHTQVDGWLRALALEKPVDAWLESRADFDAVFDHLEQCLDLRRPDGKIALLRFWDGRALLRLHRVFTQRQWRQLMGPVERWRFHMDGKPHTFEQPGTEAA